MPKVLFAWLGNTDRQALDGTTGVGLGPIATACGQLSFDVLHLLCDWREGDHSRSEEQARQVAARYVEWIREKTDITRVETHVVPLTDPNDFVEVFEAARSCVARVAAEEANELVFSFSSGTPTMGAVWLLIASTKIGAKLVQGVKRGDTYAAREVKLPIQIVESVSGEALRARFKVADHLLDAADVDLLGKSPAWTSMLRRLALYAPTDRPILIVGPTGTGKEAIARRIHEHSPRKLRAYKTLNCALIEPTLAISQLFGAEKGAFTDAKQQMRGVFEEVGDGTLFLDEVTELPLESQAKLLRVLEGKTKTFRRLGGTEDLTFRGRLVCATNRDPRALVASGALREDVYFRIGEFEIFTPPLRERPEDVDLLLDHYLPKLCAEFESGPKRLTPRARRAMLSHNWPGNVRDLIRILSRCIVETEGEDIDLDDVVVHLQPPKVSGSDLMSHVLGGEFKLESILDQVSAQYLRRALTEAGGVTTRAADLLGFSNHQRFANWCKRLRIDYRQFRRRT